MTERLHLEQPHRSLDAMPIVVMFNVDKSRVAPFLHVPPAGPLLNRQPEHVAVRRELSIESHHNTSRGTRDAFDHPRAFCSKNRTSPDRCCSIAIFRWGAGQ